jgi:hypothetical protein
MDHIYTSQFTRIPLSSSSTPKSTPASSRITSPAVSRRPSMEQLPVVMEKRTSTQKSQKELNFFMKFFSQTKN